MTQAITINLPDCLLSQIRHAAELTHQPVETIIEQSLTHSLPLLLDDIPSEYQRDGYPLLRMSPQQLQVEAQRIFPPGKWEQYEALLAKQKKQVLTADEETRLAELRREADILTLRRAYAAVLLKRQGFRTSSTDD